jgi:hypothetical protein
VTSWHCIACEQADVQAGTHLFAGELPMKAQRLSLVEARQFNKFVKNRRAMKFKCPPKSIDPNQQTNLMHTALQRCRLALQEKVGWKLPAIGGGKIKTLELRPQAQSLLSGFYPAFMIRNTDQEHSNFLQSLIETRWEMPEYASMSALCATKTTEKLLSWRLFGQNFLTWPPTWQEKTVPATLPLHAT